MTAAALFSLCQRAPVMRKHFARVVQPSLEEVAACATALRQASSYVDLLRRMAAGGMLDFAAPGADCAEQVGLFTLWKKSGQR